MKVSWFDLIISMSFAGVRYIDDKAIFSVWAPEKAEMILHIVQPEEQFYKMQKDSWGYFTIELDSLAEPYRYFYRPDGTTDYPDPASRFQPEGVHGPSEAFDQRFQWTDTTWRGVVSDDLILYELHVGTFTQQGTFEAIIERLDYLMDLGITAIELMPVAQFPGGRNWGYDGVYIYAVQNSYGGPLGLKKLVDACHNKGIAVFLDVVYNHLGPEGNYLSQFGPYFTETYKVPWGNAINYDGDWSDEVKEFFTNNAIYWFEEFHIDGLRLDAIHTIYDRSAINFFNVLDEKRKQAQAKVGRPLHLIAESDLNDPITIKETILGGFGFNAQWLDDFHHALYVLLDPNGKERYEDFGQTYQLAKAFKEGFVLSGEYVKFRKRRYGASSACYAGNKFVVFGQNHDQVGNNMGSKRMISSIGTEKQKLAAAAVLLSPYTPMLFMGEEYGETNPFYYFTDHSDPVLNEAVLNGRIKEFEKFNGANDKPPAPHELTTFESSKLNWRIKDEGNNHEMLLWYKSLIKLRACTKALQSFSKEDVFVNVPEEKVLTVYRRDNDSIYHALMIFNFSDLPKKAALPSYTSIWSCVLNSHFDMEQADTLCSSIFNAGVLIDLPPVSFLLFSAVSPR